MDTNNHGHRTNDWISKTVEVQFDRRCNPTCLLKVRHKSWNAASVLIRVDKCHDQRKQLNSMQLSDDQCLEQPEDGGGLAGLEPVQVNHTTVDRQLVSWSADMVQRCISTRKDAGTFFLIPQKMRVHKQMGLMQEQHWRASFVSLLKKQSGLNWRSKLPNEPA